MKLYLSTFQRLIELPTQDPKEIRDLLDDLIGEVKDISKTKDDTCFNVETLANRGDHLYMVGVAREFAARFLAQIHLPQVVTELSDRRLSIPIRRETELCIDFAMLEMTIPKEMQLRREVTQVMGSDTGHPPIVDLLNYVQLELGQPMHSFDRDKIEGEIIIATTDKPEEIEALNGKSYVIPTGSIVIRDKKKIVGVAGIIGCANSMTTAETSKVLLESACFDPVSVRKTARAMGLGTDASYAFERGVDPAGNVFALKRVLFLAQGAVKDGSACQPLGFTALGAWKEKKPTITLRIPEVKRHLNLPRLADVEITHRLKHLGYGVEAGKTAKECIVSIPTWRLYDVSNEMDLVEDVARSFGINRVKLELPLIEATVPEENEIDRFRAAVEPALHGNGFIEVITRGFYSEEEVSALDKLEPGIADRHVRLKDSIERSYSALKVTNVFHMATVLDRNQRNGVESGKIYEVTRIFTNSPAQEIYEHEFDIFTMAAVGPWRKTKWGKTDSLQDRLFAFKGVLEEMFDSLGVELHVGQSNHPYLHPGVRGSCKAGNFICGAFGIIHPQLKDLFQVRSDVLYAELRIHPLMKHQSEPLFVAPSPYPQIDRDITLQIGLKEPAGQVIRHIETLKLENLRSVVITDEFKRPEEQFRRVTYRITFQRQDRTLEHAEVDRDMEQIFGLLKEKDIHLAN